MARGVSKLRRGTNDGGIFRLRNSALEGCYASYKGSFSQRCVTGRNKMPVYSCYNSIVGPSIILCKRSLGSRAMGNTVGTVTSTSYLMITNADLIICPTTNFVECCGKSGFILVGGTPARTSSVTSLIVRSDIKGILSRVRME